MLSVLSGVKPVFSSSFLRVRCHTLPGTDTSNLFIMALRANPIASVFIQLAVNSSSVAQILSLESISDHIRAWRKVPEIISGKEGEVRGCVHGRGHGFRSTFFNPISTHGDWQPDCQSLLGKTFLLLGQPKQQVDVTQTDDGDIQGESIDRQLAKGSHLMIGIFKEKSLRTHHQ